MSWCLRPHLSYKPSRLPWLGKIPAHWQELRAKYLFREVDERSATDEEVHLSMSQQHGLVKSSLIEKWRLQSESYAGGKLCKKGDLILNRLKAHLGVFAHAPQDGVVSPDYTVLRPFPGVSVRYFELLFKTPMCVAELRRSTKGIVEGFWRLYTDDFYNIRVPVPPTREQRQILLWIDHFDGRMRRYIRAKQQMIALLNEQQQAIIDRAVTRGVDAGARLASSGVAWLGEVPAHWTVKALKRWAAVNQRTLPETTDPDFVFDYLDIGTVGTGFLVRTPERMRFGDAPSRARRVLSKGDTIVSTVRTYLKAVYYAAEGRDDLIASTGFAVLTPRSDVLPEYLGYVLQSAGFVERVTANSVGVAYPAIAESRLASLALALPPTLLEQQCIVDHIRGRTKSIAAAIQRAQREIALVREYRARLIADVVTGKLDVRQVAPEALAMVDGEAEPDEVEAALADEATEDGGELDGAEDAAEGEE